MLIEFHIARRIIFKNLLLPKRTDLPISKTAGLVLAKDVFATCDYPEFDKSMMDGFAICSADTKSGRAILRVIDNIKAGSEPKRNVCKGLASKIATGAMIPRGADCVVMKEDVKFFDNGKILVSKSVKSGENIYMKGKDFKKGSCLLKKGVALNMAQAALLSSQGYKKVNVYSKPLVSVIATGNEIVEPGRKKKKGQIWNASSVMLLHRLSQMNVQVDYLGIAADESRGLAVKIKSGLRSEILIITGAVSEGDLDLVPDVLRKIGAKILIHKVMVKPGKPFLFAVKDGCLIFGLPGNPVSSMVSFLLFVEPVIKRLSGLRDKLLFEEGILSKSVYNRSNRLYFHPMRLKRKNDRYIVEPLVSSGSADLLSVSKADGFLMLKPSQEIFKKNSAVKFLRLF